MNEFDWIKEIDESVFVGLKFRIPTNQSLSESIVKITLVYGDAVVLTTKRMGSHIMTKASANKFIKDGVWVIIEESINT